jgi:hypothetical protein
VLHASHTCSINWRPWKEGCSDGLPEVLIQEGGGTQEACTQLALVPRNGRAHTLVRLLLRRQERREGGSSTYTESCLSILDMVCQG